MSNISKPLDRFRDRLSGRLPLRWENFVQDIIKGKYVLLLGSEVVLDQQYGGGDSSVDILQWTIDDLKSLSLLGEDFKCDTFTELARKTGRTDKSIRELISDTLFGSDYYERRKDAFNKDLRSLLETRFFRIVMTTTYDSHIEKVMRDIWGDELKVKGIYDDGEHFDYDEKQQSSEEFILPPTLYYICGRANENDQGRRFVATENEAREAVVRWFSDNAPNNFLSSIKTKGVISLGCKFDDWLFRFVWYILRKDINQIDTSLKDAVAVSFSSESGQKLKGYLASKNVYTEENAHEFIRKILNSKDDCIRRIAETSSNGGVFLSYAHEDMPVVAIVANRLRKEGFNVWFDSSELHSGDSFDNVISNAIAQCKIFMPVLSLQVGKDLMNGIGKDLMNGNNIRYYCQEWALARQQLGIRQLHVMPVAINGYDVDADYHKHFPFEGLIVDNLMKTPMSLLIQKMKSKD